MMMVPAKSFLIAGALATSGVVAGIITIPRDETIVVESPSIPVGVKSDALASFEESFRSATAAVALQTAAVERALPTEPAPALVAAKPEPAPGVPSASAEVDSERSIQRGRHVAEERNLCTRNGMRKVWVSRKKWRCRK
jgi:hypothetical protein